MRWKLVGLVLSKSFGVAIVRRSAWTDTHSKVCRSQPSVRVCNERIRLLAAPFSSLREMAHSKPETLNHRSENEAFSGAIDPVDAEEASTVTEESMKDSSSHKSVQNRQKPPPARKGSVDAKETAKFEKMADAWWDYEGPYKPLHSLNPVRLSFVRSALCRKFQRKSNNPRPLEGLSIIDIGCGGGLLCEPLSRMGAQVMGIDAVEKNIIVASLHAEKDPLTSSINYFCSTAEQLVQEQQKFDVVIALEVIEHVADPKEFISSLADLVNLDGVIIISTINRSISAFGLAIVAAEYILHWLPKGTHDWFKLITPEELALLADHSSLKVQEIAGMVYNPLLQTWSLSDDLNVNYIAWLTKNS